MKPHMMPFFDAMQDLIRAGEPAPKSCRGCGGGGELPEGGPCNWCGPQEDSFDYGLEAETEKLRAIERSGR